MLGLGQGRGHKRFSLKHIVLRDEPFNFLSVSTLLNVHAFLPSENRVNSCTELKENFL